MGKGRSHTSMKYQKGSGEEMPTIEKVNFEMTSYLQDIEKYIENYKSLPQKEAKQQAKKNLIDVGIIDEQGNLVDFYKN